MDINEYLIDTSNKDWFGILTDWRTVLPDTFTSWLVNRFGDLFVIPDDGSVHMLDIGRGECRKLADNRDQFARLLDLDDNANQWLMVPLVDQCVAEGMRLVANQCCSFAIPPLPGGSYEISNIHVADIAVTIALQADIYRQTKDSPDGTPVNLVTIEGASDIWLVPAPVR